MAKQELLDKIIGDAEERARTILSEAESKAASAVASAEEERATLLDSARKMAAASQPEVVKRRRSMAELEVRKEILREKQAQISKVYEQAILAIRESDAYPRLLAKMIASSAEAGDGVIFAACDAGRVDPAKIVAAAEKEAGVKLTLLDELGAFCGGIVLRGKDCDKNLSLEVELESIRSEEDLTAKVLFG